LRSKKEERGIERENRRVGGSKSLVKDLEDNARNSLRQKRCMAKAERGVEGIGDSGGGEALYFLEICGTQKGRNGSKKEQEKDIRERSKVLGKGRLLPVRMTLRKQKRAGPF